MKNAIALRLDEPCSQEWSNMTPSEQGRYCDSCQKQVIDFTQLTDNEILQIIAANPNGFCGQFRETQLNRTIVESKLNGGSARLNSLVAGIMVAAGAGTLSAQSTSTPPVQQEVVIDEKHPTGPVCLRQTQNDTSARIVNLTITDDASGVPIANALIFVPGTKFGVTTDSTGKAVLTVPYSIEQDSLNLVVQSSGHETKRISVSTASPEQSLIVSLPAREIIRVFLGKPVLYVPEQNKK